MARVYLDHAYEFALSGNKVYLVYFNTDTKQVEADYIGNQPFFDLGPVTYAFGEVAYDQCFGLDRYQVIKMQPFPFGAVSHTPNSNVCAASVLNSALYRYNDASGDEMGDLAADTCDFAGSRYLYFEGVIEVGSVLYENTSLDLLPYSGTGWFRIGTTAYQIDTDSEVITITPAACEIVAPLPDPEALDDLDIEAAFHLPQASSLRFIKETVVDQITADNSLWAAQKIPGVIWKPFDQVCKKGESVTIQFGSSYPTNSVKIYNAVTNALVDTIAPSLVRENLNLELTVPGFAASDESVIGIQVWFPNYPFPEFAFAGNTVNLEGDQINGQYAITGVQDGKGQARGNRVAVVNFTVPTPAGTAVQVTGKYHAEPYNVYEATIPFDTNGRYYAVIEVSGGGFDAQSARSEPIRVTDQLDEYLKIEYTNDEDEFGCYYGNDLTHQLWINSRMFQAFPGGEKTISRETTARLVKNDEYITKVLTWECNPLPPYLIMQISIALSHDEVRLNGILIQTEEQPEVEYYMPSPFGNLTVSVEEVEFTTRNKEGGSIDDSDSFLLINNAGNKLLINP